MNRSLVANETDVVLDELDEDKRSVTAINTLELTNESREKMLRKLSYFHLLDDTIILFQ